MPIANKNPRWEWILAFGSYHLAFMEDVYDLVDSSRFRVDIRRKTLCGRPIKGEVGLSSEEQPRRNVCEACLAILTESALIGEISAVGGGT